VARGGPTSAFPPPKRCNEGGGGIPGSRPGSDLLLLYPVKYIDTDITTNLLFIPSKGPGAPPRSKHGATKKRNKIVERGPWKPSLPWPNKAAPSAMAGPLFNSAGLRKMMPIVDDITDDIAFLAVVVAVASWINLRGANFEFLRYAGDRFVEGVAWIDAHPVRRRMAQVTARSLRGMDSNRHCARLVFAPPHAAVIAISLPPTSAARPDKPASVKAIFDKPSKRPAEDVCSHTHAGRPTQRQTTTPLCTARWGLMPILLAFLLVSSGHILAETSYILTM